MARPTWLEVLVCILALFIGTCGVVAFALWAVWPCGRPDLPVRICAAIDGEVVGGKQPS